ncbi:D-alanine--D-alanine ligase [Formicincola oecophyllae]|uniref:D-alanine--D-alanine ligase n=1 Tax=Formicincola oecophyllae TaxID=2558361 RepID=A0A4Y6UD11_9PROT|nr:D-alanine--D-alanine ligase [Formicincola oecophyllae]
MRVAVLGGGISSERPISLTGAKACVEALKSLGHDAALIDVGPDLAWTVNDLQALNPDAALNILHGPGGEDGTIQGVLAWMGIPCSHSGVRASALAMDKAATRAILEAAGLPVAPGQVMTPQQLAAKAPMAMPYVVKPLAEGSSVGVHIVREADEGASTAHERIAHEWTHGPTMLVEAFIPGRELTVGVVDGKPLLVTEIITPTSSFYDFEAKYSTGGSRHILPADLPESTTQKALDIARRAHEALGCEGASRVDFRLDERTGELFILEINTQPGMTPTSLLPEQAAKLGMDYPHLCEWLVLDAIRRPPIIKQAPAQPKGTAGEEAGAPPSPLPPFA